MIELTLWAASPMVMMRPKDHFLKTYSGKAVRVEETLFLYNAPKGRVGRIGSFKRSLMMLCSSSLV